MAERKAYYDEMMGNARRRVAEMDKIDEASGNATPQQVGAGELLRTAMTAIRAGIEGKDFRCVADGQVMLGTLHQQMFKIPFEA